MLCKNLNYLLLFIAILDYYTFYSYINNNVPKNIDYLQIDLEP